MRIFPRKKNGVIVNFYLELDKNTRISLKTKNRDEAVLQAAKLLKEMEEGKHNFQVVKIASKFITVKEFMLLYKEHLEKDNYSKAHIRNHNIALNYLLLAVGDIALKNINSNHFEAYKLFRINIGHKISYINTDIKKVRSAFNWAVFKAYLNRNPFIGGKPIREKGKAIDDDIMFMLPSHVNILRESLANSQIKFKTKTGKEMWQDMLECFLYTGARRHEIVGLQRKDINFITGKVTLRDYKNDRSHIVTIHERLRPVLMRLVKNKQDRIFDVTVNHVSNMFTKLLKEAKLSQFVGTHVFRYTVISLLICEGCTAEQVALAIGHATPETTMKIYAKIHSSYKKEIFAKLPY